jgi:hypothetical protein
MQNCLLQPQSTEKAAAHLVMEARVTSACRVQAPDSQSPSMVLVLVATEAKVITAWPTPTPGTLCPKGQGVVLRAMEVRGIIASLAGELHT